MASKRKSTATLLQYFNVSSAKKQSTEGDSDTSTQESPTKSDKTGCPVVEAGPSSTTDSASVEASDSESASIAQSVQSDSKRHFQQQWCRSFKWLDYNEREEAMTCTLCIKHKKNNTFTTGKCQNFKTSILTRHADSNDHKQAVQADAMTVTLQRSFEKVFDEKEAAIVKAMKVAFWMCKEDISISKFESLVDLLEHLECPGISNLKTGKTTTYKSDKSACEFIHTIALTIRQNIYKKIEKSPFVSILCDESTDIGTKKKLSVYSRVIDPETFQAATVFLCNKEIDSGTGQGIFDALKNIDGVKDIPRDKIMGLGTDGAKVMTGLGAGLTGYMTRENPMLLNYHCIAHKLALVTSQAADEVPFLIDYQSVLTGIFYFFKASAKRCYELNEIERVLNEPSLKVKEVHEVRWMSIFLAVETVYKILDSLITFFCESKDAKAKGYGKKMIQQDFIATTYLLMDVLPVVTELCMIFQKEDLDISYVKVAVDHCKTQLTAIKEGKAPHLEQLSDKDLTIEKGKVVFKKNHIVQGKQNIESIKSKFIDAILEKLDQRFPDNDSNIIYSFAVLAMRPISFCSKSDLKTWGDEKLELLIKQYGESKVSKPRGDQPEVTKEPIIDSVATRVEWETVKPLVLQEGYPRDKMSTLWQLISMNYKEQFPNLLKLAALSITAPIHTSDCERGFSAQNLVKTSMRNRLGAETVDDLLIVKIEGGKLPDFDFTTALKLWKEKQRKLFCVKNK